MNKKILNEIETNMSELEKAVELIRKEPLSKDEISCVAESMLAVLGYMTNEVANIQREIGTITENEYYIITKLGEE